MSNEKQKNSLLPKLKVDESYYLFLPSTMPVNWTKTKFLLWRILPLDLVVTLVEMDNNA